MTARRVRMLKIAAALALAGAAVFIATTGVVDELALARIRSRVSGAGLPNDERLLSARSALMELAALDAAPAWRHAWVRTVGVGSRDRTVRAVETALARAEAVANARAANLAWLAAQRVRLEQATTLPELEALLAALRAGAPSPDGPLTVGEMADLISDAEVLSAAYAEDDRRNEAALASLQAQLAAAGSDVAKLQLVLDAVLPRKERHPPLRTTALATIQMDAQGRRSRVLTQRVQEREDAARRAQSAAQVRVELVALDRDPDLRRGVDRSVGLAAARARIAARADALDSWEVGRRSMEERMSSDDPIGAARVLAELRAPDEQRARELGQLRVGYGVRAAYALTRAVLRMAEGNDWSGARRLIAEMQTDAAVHAALDENGRVALDRALRALAQTEDRMLYEAFRAAPRKELAARYLEGWPTRPRRMGPLVLAYMAWLDAPRTDVLLESVDWHTVGAKPAQIQDLPDATVELRANGALLGTVVVEDISDKSLSVVEPALRVHLEGPDDTVLRLEATVRIDLRDTISDPVATGFAVVSPAELRACTTVMLRVVDRAWSPQPHRLHLRAVAVGAPPLPPWEVNAYAPFQTAR